MRSLMHVNISYKMARVVRRHALILCTLQKRRSTYVSTHFNQHSVNLSITTEELLFPVYPKIDFLSWKDRFEANVNGNPETGFVVTRHK